MRSGGGSIDAGRDIRRGGCEGYLLGFEYKSERDGLVWGWCLEMGYTHQAGSRAVLGIIMGNTASIGMDI